jgi:hypothetical protein
MDHLRTLAGVVVSADTRRLHMTLDIEQLAAIARALEMYELRAHDVDEYRRVRSMRRRLQAYLLQIEMVES